MKTIMLKPGIVLSVPDWTNYVAQDREGLWWAFEGKPRPNQITSGKWVGRADAKADMILVGFPNLWWQETLQEVPQ